MGSGILVPARSGGEFNLTTLMVRQVLQRQNEAVLMLVESKTSHSRRSIIFS
ncbi:MAG: hypothetical protein M3Q03_08560 [Chloroflexota bacterium]|nr:hypothetical protein [Chloroflexota bacterium]